MAKQYLGLKGNALVHFMIYSVVFPTYILLGYNNAVFGGLLSLDSFLKTFPKTAEPNIQGTTVSLYTVGCMIGALSCFRLGDRFGRLRTITIGAILVIVGSVLLSSSFSLAQLLVGRLVTGLGFGAMSATVPVWQSESSPSAHRGALVVLEGVAASIGLALSQWVDLGFFFATGSVSWRAPLAIPIVFAAIVLAVLPFLPDSPRWLVKQGRVDEARHLMAILENVDVDSDVVAEDIRKMQVSLAETGKGGFASLLRNGEDRLLNRTLLAMFSAFSQQMNGIGVIGFYTQIIFETFIGLSPVVSRVLAATVYMWQILTCFVAFSTVDRYGRRKLMMFGTTGMGVCFAVVAGTVSQPGSKACSIVAAVAVFLIAFFFGVGALGVNYLYGTEVAPLAYRVPIYALTSCTLWSMNFLVVEVTPVGFANLGYKFFVVFAVINLALLTPVVCFYFPETQRRSLEDMDTIFLSSKSAIAVVKTARHMPRVTANTMEDMVGVVEKESSAHVEKV